MKKPTYPLEQVLDIKKKRVKDAEAVVKEKQKVLDAENEKLNKYLDALKKIEDHYKDKLEQLRAALDGGKQPHKTEEMKVYLKEVKSKRWEEERKVERQKKQVENAQKKLDEAVKILKEKRLEVDKLETHKAEWIQEEIKRLRKEEAKNLDEIGSLVFQSNKRKTDIQKENVKKKKKNG